MFLELVHYQLLLLGFGEVGWEGGGRHEYHGVVDLFAERVILIQCVGIEGARAGEGGDCR